jgi:hypothetical protein
VKQFDHDDFQKLDGTYIGNIRPGKKAGDPIEHYVRAIQYTKNGNIKYKLSFHDEWKYRPQLVTIPSNLHG